MQENLGAGTPEQGYICPEHVALTQIHKKPSMMLWTRWDLAWDDPEGFLFLVCQKPSYDSAVALRNLPNLFLESVRKAACWLIISIVNQSLSL